MIHGYDDSGASGHNEPVSATTIEPTHTTTVEYNLPVSVDTFADYAYVAASSLDNTLAQPAEVVTSPSANSNPQAILAYINRIDRELHKNTKTVELSDNATKLILVLASGFNAKKHSTQHLLYSLQLFEPTRHVTEIEILTDGEYRERLQLAQHSELELDNGGDEAHEYAPAQPSDNTEQLEAHVQPDPTLLAETDMLLTEIVTETVDHDAVNLQIPVTTPATGNIEPAARPVETTNVAGNYSLISHPVTASIDPAVSIIKSAPIPLAEFPESAECTLAADPNPNLDYPQHNSEQRYQAELLRIVGIIDSKVAAQVEQAEVVDGQVLRLTLRLDAGLPCIDEQNWLRRLRGFTLTRTIKRIKFVVTTTKPTEPVTVGSKGDMLAEPGDVSNSANSDGADITDTEANQAVKSSKLLPVQQVQDIAEVKMVLRAMRQAESKKLAELKAVRDVAARKFDFTKAHTGPTGNDWVSFARANAEWCQAHLAMCGNYPPNDEIDAKTMLWTGKFQK
jgi:hypothetical protein